MYENKGQETKGDYWRDQRYMSDVMHVDSVELIGAPKRICGKRPNQVSFFVLRKDTFC